VNGAYNRKCNRTELADLVYYNKTTAKKPQENLVKKESRILTKVMAILGKLLLCIFTDFRCAFNLFQYPCPFNGNQSYRKQTSGKDAITKDWVPLERYQLISQKQNSK
jgi:hypothetical protein